MQRRTFLLAGTAMLFLPISTRAEALQATLYKNPQCSCCEGYAAEISRKAGVPEDLEGCHTMFIDGYVIDGHVPVNVIRKLLAERPAIAGITLPGMPMGSPGMAGTKTEAFTIYAVTKDGKAPAVYATE